MKQTPPTTWPKVLPILSDAQKAISDDFVKVWHETLPRYGLVENFNHGWVAKTAPEDFETTLEIGAGLGEHLSYETLNEAQEKGYVAIDIRENMVAELHKRYPQIRSLVADCQQKLAFEDGLIGCWRYTSWSICPISHLQSARCIDYAINRGGCFRLLFRVKAA
jgi:hypothetical protein